MAMKTFNTGDVLSAADVTEYLENVRFVSKPTDTARASNTTISDDPHLTLTVDANKTYHLEMFIQFHGLSGADLQWTFGAPAGAVLNGMAFMPDLTATSGTGPYKTVAYNNSIAITSTRTTGTLAVVSDQGMWCRGTLVVSSTAGQLTFRWAQNTTSPTGTVIINGSSMILRRVS